MTTMMVLQHVYNTSSNKQHTATLMTAALLQQ